jgi:hypothetical protein
MWLLFFLAFAGRGQANSIAQRQSPFHVGVRHAILLVGQAKAFLRRQPIEKVDGSYRMISK